MSSDRSPGRRYSAIMGALRKSLAGRLQVGRPFPKAHPSRFPSTSLRVCENPQRQWIFKRVGGEPGFQKPTAISTLFGVRDGTGIAINPTDQPGCYSPRP